MKIIENHCSTAAILYQILAFTERQSGLADTVASRRLLEDHKKLIKDQLYYF